MSEDTAKDYLADEAIERIREMTSEDEVLAFIEGDERKTVNHEAKEWIEKLRKISPKEGQVAGKITDDTKDFKGPGVQGKKNYVTCEDVIKSLRGKGVKI